MTLVAYSLKYEGGCVFLTGYLLSTTCSGSSGFISTSILSVIVNYSIKFLLCHYC